MGIDHNKQYASFWLSLKGKILHNPDFKTERLSSGLLSLAWGGANPHLVDSYNFYHEHERINKQYPADLYPPFKFGITVRSSLTWKGNIDILVILKRKKFYWLPTRKANQNKLSVVLLYFLRRKDERREEGNYQENSGN